MASITQSFDERIARQPEVFFSPSEETAAFLKQLTKQLFDAANDPENASVALDELYIDGFDSDQIWEQMQLQNKPLLKDASKTIRLLSKTDDPKQFFPLKTDAEEEDEHEEENTMEQDAEVEEEGEEEEEEILHVSEEEEDDEDGDQAMGEQEEDPNQTKKKTAAKKKKKKRDVLEDGFFNWDEMEKAAEEEEVSEDSADDDDGDDDDEDDPGEEEEEEDFELEADDSEDGDETRYDDFFDKPLEEEEEGDDDEDEQEDEQEEEEDELLKSKKAKKKSEANGDNAEPIDEDDLAERGILSSHQKRQLRLQQEISKLEQENLGDKPWLLKGEVKSTVRPENSLLEAVLDYERPAKVAPVITVEVSMELEDMIKKRILDEQFDDVLRKWAPNEEANKGKGIDVSMEKSKEGLGEIYEKEYMKTAMGFEQDDGSKQDQNEIEVMFKSLCWKLDALSNFHFTPKPMVKELQVKPSVPAIAMEEAVPIGVSDANLQAPEEILDKKRKRGEVMPQSKEEMTQNERKALRNAKKHARRKNKKQKAADEKLAAKINPGLGNKYEKQKLLKSLESSRNVVKGKEADEVSFTNSKAFFARLQDEVKQQVKSKAAK